MEGPGICTEGRVQGGGGGLLLRRSVGSPPFAVPWTVACHTPLSKELSSREYWSGWSFPTPGNLHAGTEPSSAAGRWTLSLSHPLGSSSWMGGTCSVQTQTPGPLACQHDHPSPRAWFPDQGSLSLRETEDFLFLC